MQSRTFTFYIQNSTFSPIAISEAERLNYVIYICEKKDEFK